MQTCTYFPTWLLTTRTQVAQADVILDSHAGDGRWSEPVVSSSNKESPGDICAKTILWTAGG